VRPLAATSRALVAVALFGVPLARPPVFRPLAIYFASVLDAARIAKSRL
jgi:hypothetical protein